MHQDVPAHKNRQESVNVRCRFDLHIKHRYVKKKKNGKERRVFLYNAAVFVSETQLNSNKYTKVFITS